MEVARCILLLLQLFLHLLSTYTNLPHLSLNQSFSCFLQLLSSASSLFTFSIHFMYHCHHQNTFLKSSKNITIPPHTICPCQLISASFNPNISISSSVFLLSTNFTLHIALTIDLSALLKIAT